MILVLCQGNLWVCFLPTATLADALSVVISDATGNSEQGVEAQNSWGVFDLSHAGSVLFIASDGPCAAKALSKLVSSYEEQD